MGDFPNGFGDAAISRNPRRRQEVLVFEGGMTYHLKGKDTYLTVVN